MSRKISVIMGVHTHDQVLKQSMQELGSSYEIHYVSSTLDQEGIIGTARTLRAEGTEIIICGITVGRTITRHVDIPVVTIKRSTASFARQIRSVQRMGLNCAVVGPEGNFILAAERSQELLDEKVPIHVYRDDDEIRHILEACVREGIDAIVSSSDYLSRLAEQYHLRYIRVPFDQEDIVNAFREAEALLYEIEERVKNNLTLNLIQNVVGEGIIVLNGEGEILEVNRAARLSLGLVSSIVGKNIEDGSVHINSSDGQSILLPRENDIARINNQIYYLNTHHIRIHDQLASIILTFRPVEQIQKAEQEIRKQLHSKGNVANYTFSDIIGQDPVTLQTISAAKRYAAAGSTVLIYGPSGCGKEMFAQSIHNASSRKNGPFVVINCAALPENLLESILFGYEKGAFTGAVTTGKKGLFELAHGGTIFIDEIGEMPLATQTRFLRVLQEREVTPIGSDQVIPIDVRVICATNRNLEEMVEDKRFREDLYYRISVLILDIPPLRERREDIALLAKYFLFQKSRDMGIPVTQFSDEALSLLSEMDFPGNIRQLSNFIERVLVLSTEKVVSAEMVRAAAVHQIRKSRKPVHTPAAADAAVREGDPDPVAEAEKKRILEAMRRCGYRKQETANALGISYSTLWRKMKRLCISWNEIS